MVENILRFTGTPRNFTLIETNVESIAAVLDGEKRYILYSQDYFIKIKEKAVAYGLLAHEIGHHAASHTFDPAFREKEELEADFFMGYALCKTQGIRPSSAAAVPATVPFSYDIPADQRKDAIVNGWKRADAHLRAKDNLAYYDDGTGAASDWPRFPWPPPQCAQREVVSEKLIETCHTLAEVDNRLRRALNGRGYAQRSYFQTPNGFAIVTQLEQFNTDGASKSGQTRWVDYPVQDNFNGLWGYLSSLFVPNSGYFRIFVFVVTDVPYNQSARRVSKEEAVGWLSQGLNILPREIGQMPVNDNHYLDVLVYEFEAPQTTKRCAQKCPSLKDCNTHLAKSGLRDALRANQLSGK